MTTALCDATIFTGDAMVEGHALLIESGKILDIVARHDVSATAQIVSYPGKILAPGLIDAQVNGGDNILFNEKPTPEKCIAIAEAHRKRGTTRLLPTCITDRPEITRQAITAARAARQKCPSVLGIHIEGPHIGLERRGAHNADLIRGMTEEDMRLYRREANEVMLVTLAPENASPKQIAGLHEQGIVVALGHTNATAGQVRAALTSGARGFTHLFNGMGGLYARDAGPAAIALDDRTSWCSIIADGHHVAPEMIRLALRAKPPGKVFLVSDAMPPAASRTPAAFALYGEMIRVENRRCVNPEGKLAGTAITLLEAVRYCVENVGVDIAEALRMASLYPASFLGLDGHLGKLLPGYMADIVVLSPDLKHDAVWMQGCSVAMD